MRTLGAMGALALAATALASCNGKPSAVADSRASAAPTFAAAGQTRSPDPRDAPIPRIAGKPMWAPNRNHTAEENAQYQFSKNGGDFAAKSEAEYVSDAHRFVDHPPGDVETLDRPNGDKLLYDPKANIFAVVARNGAPRTMFKPKTGDAYWTQQKDREATREKTGSGGESQQG